MNKKKHELPFLLRDGWADFLVSVICIAVGFLLGYIVLLCIHPEGAGNAVWSIVRNFFYYKNPEKVKYYFASTLVKTVPLLLCSLSVLFAKKAGLFNIGVAGQYTVGIGATLWCALFLKFPWYLCIFTAIAAGALYAMLIGFFKAYRNVNEVISGIMLNWIGLYLVNMLLLPLKDPAGQYTVYLEDNAPGALLPSLGLEKWFGGNGFIGIGVILAPIVAILVAVLIRRTKLGYELRATGYNKNAAFYCGMKEKHNIILTMAISGALAGLGAALLFLTDIEQWMTSASSVPSVGFDGIAAAFLGGLDPIGAIFSSYFIKHITLGGMYIDKSFYSAQTADLISSFIIYLSAFAQFFRHFATQIYKKKKAKGEKSSCC